MDGMEDISADRTVEATELIEENGGSVVSGYALLGDFDLVLICEFPGVEDAMKTSVELSQMLEIGFTTYPAVSVEAFDRLVG
jgi:uncharacterized protein with GYD domain